MLPLCAMRSSVFSAWSMSRSSGEQHTAHKGIAYDTRYVPEGHPAVFDITKRKIHNVLQGVAEKGIEMNDVDKQWFEVWTKQNCGSSVVPILNVS